MRRLALDSTVMFGCRRLRRLTGIFGFENAATVTVVLREEDGTAVSAAVACTYVAGSNGDYEGSLDTTSLSLVRGRHYIEEFEAETATRKRVWRRRVIADYA